MTPQLIVPEPTNGAASFCAPSIRMPILLYLSTRVRSMISLRAPSTGASSAFDVCTMPMPGCEPRQPPARVYALSPSEVTTFVTRRAVDRALGVEEEDAGLDGDLATLRVVAVDGDAGDVDRQRLRRGADDGDDVADAVADVRRVLEDAPADQRCGLRGDRHEVGPGTLQRDAVGDRQGVGALGTRALGVFALADDDGVAVLCSVDRGLHRRVGGCGAVGLVVVDRERCCICALCATQNARAHKRG